MHKVMKVNSKSQKKISTYLKLLLITCI